MLVLASVAALADDLTPSHEFTYNGTDKTTDGTISLTNATTGTTYSLYKLLSATYSGTNVAYSIKSTDPAYGHLDSSYFTVATQADANGNYAVTRAGSISEGTFTPTKTDAQLLEYLSGLLASNPEYFTLVGAILSDVNGTIAWNNLPYGYYFIKPDKPASGAVLTIDSAAPSASVIDKNQVPEFDKNIVDGANLIKLNEAGLAIDVPFDITVQAKNFDGEYKIYEYTIKDTMDPGFTLKNDMRVMVGSADKTSDTLTTITYYTDSTKTTTTTYDKAGYFEINVKWTTGGDKTAAHLYPANETIKVTYTAFLDPAKADQVHVGATPNENKAIVDYKKYKDNDDVEGHLPEQKTKTFETSLTITKTDGTDPLPGAEFTLVTSDGTTVSYTTGEIFVENASAEPAYYKLKDGTYTTTEKTDATANKYVDGTTKYEKKTILSIGANQTVSTMKAFVGSDGKLTFSGLGTGTYTLKETVVPKGYNKADDITFTISFDAREKIDNPDNPGTQIDNPNFQKFASNNSAIVLNATNNVFNTTVVNNKGTELPHTGGVGTTIFYIAGSILVLAAVIFLVTKRRMNANND